MKRNILRELTFAFFVLCHVSCGKEFFLSKVNVNDNQKIHGNFEYIYNVASNSGIASVVLFTLK